MTKDKYAKEWAETAAVEQPAFWERHGIRSVNDIVKPTNITEPVIRAFLERLAEALSEAREVCK